MRKYSTNLAFADLNMNLLLGFVTLFILAFLMINPVADEGKIDPEGLLVVTMQWDETSPKDMDIWMRGPDGITVSYRKKDSGAGMFLDRDDLGYANDMAIIDGEAKPIPRNMEVVTVTMLPDGEYIINAHHFNIAPGETIVTVEVVGLLPYKIWFSGEVTLTASQEVTVVSFKVTNGVIHDIRTDLQIGLRTRGGSDAG